MDYRAIMNKVKQEEMLQKSISEVI